MWTDGGPSLIDWDTVALGPPERDLWMVLGRAVSDTTAYADATGHEPDPTAMDFFRLAWDLGDLAAYVDVLRSPHRENEDTRTAYAGLTRSVAIRDQRAALLGHGSEAG